MASDSEDSEEEAIRKAPAKQVKFWTGKKLTNEFLYPKNNGEGGIEYPVILPPRLPLSGKDNSKRRNSITCIQPYKKRTIDNLYEFVMETTGGNLLGMMGMGGPSRGTRGGTNMMSSLGSGMRSRTLKTNKTGGSSHNVDDERPRKSRGDKSDKKDRKSSKSGKKDKKSKKSRSSIKSNEDSESSAPRERSTR
jgi:hypothetical protein